MKSPEPQAPDHGATEPPEHSAPLLLPGIVPAPVVYPDHIAPSRIDPDAVKVLKRLTRHGYDAYLVGGGVRDQLHAGAPLL
jgi:poly(A) polymerase